MKKLAGHSKARWRKDIRTKVDVQEGCVGSLHQDLLRRTMKSLIHEVHAVPHHGLDLLRVALKAHERRDCRSSSEQLCLRPSPLAWPALRPRRSPESGTWTCTAWPALYTCKQQHLISAFLLQTGRRRRSAVKHLSRLASAGSAGHSDAAAHRSENWPKSDSRSHIRRPLRAAFAEYTGPMPFFVVPKLGGAEGQRKEEEKSPDKCPQMHTTSAFATAFGTTQSTAAKRESQNTKKYNPVCLKRRHPTGNVGLGPKLGHFFRSGKKVDM